MLKKIALALIIVLLSVQPSTSAVKNGQQCSKIGATTKSKKITYTCTQLGKKKVWTTLKPASPKPSPSVTPVAEKLIVKKSPKPLEVCRIPDQSPTQLRKRGPSIAYPVPTGEIYAHIPTQGPIRIAIIPIDFPDVVGSQPPQNIYADDVKQIDEWMKWYSDGKSFYEWQLGTNWIRAPRPSFDYVPLDSPQFDRGNPLTGARVGRSINSVQIADEFYTLAEKEFNLENLHAVLFIYPKEVIHIWDLIVRNGAIQGIGHPAKGPDFFEVKVIEPRLLKTWIMATGAFMYRNNFPLWSWVVHEVLHNQGLQGHAPNQGSPMGIMTNQWGGSFALNAWDTTVLDWQRQDDVYCLEKDDLKIGHEIQLVPLEMEQVGNKSVMIKLSNSQVLVVESHRKDKWSNSFKGFGGLPMNFRGVMVYKVDTTKEPLYGIEEPDGDKWIDGSEAFAYYIRNNKVKHGVMNLQYGRLDLNFVMYAGESLVTNGIKISFVESKTYDRLEITLNS